MQKVKLRRVLPSQTCYLLKCGPCLHPIEGSAAACWRLVGRLYAMLFLGVPGWGDR